VWGGGCMRARGWQHAYACARVALLIKNAKRRHTVCLHHIFRQYLINGTIFGKRLLNIKCVFWLPLKFSIETFHTSRKIQPGTKFHQNLSSGSRIIPLHFWQESLDYLYTFTTLLRSQTLRPHKNNYHSRKTSCCPVHYLISRIYPVKKKRNARKQEFHIRSSPPR
jgi:hypothetical protein